MDRRQLARRLQASCGLTGHFVLRSGEVSDFYFDKYLFEAVPELLDAVAELASPLVPDGTENPGRPRARRGTHFDRLVLEDRYPSGARS